MTLDADTLACAALVERADPDRFAATMASPLAARAILFPLYAFNVEVARAPWVTQEPTIAEMRLQWWRDALEEIAQGKIPRRHQVVTPLAALLTPAQAQELDALVAARRWDIYRDPFDDEAHFDRYIDATAACLMRTVAAVLAERSGARLTDAARASVSHLGSATGLARFLKAVPDLEARGRIPLVDGRPAAIADRAKRTLMSCPRAGTIRRLLPRAARPAATEAFLTAATLGQIAANPVRVAHGDLEVPALRRNLLLWKWSRIL